MISFRLGINQGLFCLFEMGASKYFRDSIAITIDFIQKGSSLLFSLMKTLDPNSLPKTRSFSLISDLMMLSRWVPTVNILLFYLYLASPTSFSFSLKIGLTFNFSKHKADLLVSHLSTFIVSPSSVVITGLMFSLLYGFPSCFFLLDSIFLSVYLNF